MNEGVHKHEHPDWRAHVPNASPHTQHSTRMVVRLQSCAPLALGDDYQGVDNLVKLADVEHPTPECKAFVPQSAHIGRIWHAVIS